eukprot:TRINITY_DN6809_c0_g1_i1.p2 TRINITY_DN6809_c0_g1~~TRINITY_DN6809_c0_g1_i1.p2  ORF type:complete len:101 (-),score=24.41 TRINITY_DN6809_c0_g1_i1:135-437(-)
MIRRPPRSTQGVSSAASDVYKRQLLVLVVILLFVVGYTYQNFEEIRQKLQSVFKSSAPQQFTDVKYDILHANENDEELVCLLYTSPSPRDLSTSRMPSSA